MVSPVAARPDDGESISFDNEFLSSHARTFYTPRRGHGRMSLRIVLISPKGPLYRHRGGIFKRSLRYAPLTLTTLAALVPPELGAELQLIDEGIEDVDLDLHADLVGMTVITGTAMRSYELSAHFRRRG